MKKRTRVEEIKKGQLQAAYPKRLSDFVGSGT